MVWGEGAQCSLVHLQLSSICKFGDDIIKKQDICLKYSAAAADVATHAAASSGIAN